MEQVCIDATYKLNWCGYPLIVFGTVDRKKKFHPFLYACTSGETTDDYAFVFETVKIGIEVYFEQSFEPETLIADGAIQIRNAFYSIFESGKMDIMCFAHVIRNLRKRTFAMKNNKQLILDDVRKLQSSANRATELISKQLTELISTQFSNGTRDISTEPCVKNSMMTAAALMFQQEFKCFKAKSSNNNVAIYIVPSHQCDAINANERYYRSLVQREWSSFDEFVEYGYQMFYLVQVSKTSWNIQSTCTCISFFKQNICKHIIAIVMREKIIECPDIANPTLLNKYKRRGRPEKANKALQFQ